MAITLCSRLDKLHNATMVVYSLFYKLIIGSYFYCPIDFTLMLDIITHFQKGMSFFLQFILVNLACAIFNSFTESVSIMLILCYQQHVHRIWDLYRLMKATPHFCITNCIITIKCTPI